MLNPREIIVALLVMLNQDGFILIRIEFLVIAISGLFLVMVILDFRRNRAHAALRNAILKILDGVSDSMVNYALGGMQAASFRNQLFPVWAMVVVSFRSSIDYISGRVSRGLETGNLMRPLGLAIMNSRRGSELKVQLWTLWGVMVLRSSYRLLARFMVSNRSIWSVHKAGLIPEYMRGDHEDTNLKPDACNPWTMDGYTFLVYGESSQRLHVQRPRYILFLRIVRPRLLVTLDKVWQCDGRLLSSNGSKSEHLKDMCLAFTLSGLLRCRIKDIKLHSDSHLLIRNLVRSKILMKSANRAFRILDLELTFLNDTLHTRYPIVFWNGLCSLAGAVAVSLLTVGVALWLAVDIHRIYDKPPEGDRVHIVHGANVDVIITWVLMAFMMVKEIWEMLTYLLSDWTRLLLVCNYVQWNVRCMRNSLMEKLIWSFFTSKIGGRWHGFIDQYEFFRSFDYVPSFWNFLNSVTLGLTPSKNNGEKVGRAIKVPDCIKPAIMQTLRSFINLAEQEEGGGFRLPGYMPSLSAGDLQDRFGWACNGATLRCSQVILVWHIATSLCEIEAALEHQVNLSNPGCLRSTMSWLTSCFGCSRQLPYLVDHNILQGGGDMSTNFQTANSLSRYCAYLVTSQLDMLPDSFLFPELIFKAAVEYAGKFLMKEDDSLDKRHSRLTEWASGLSGEQKRRVKSVGNPVEQGAVLALELIQLDDTTRWKTLAQVWTDLIVHIAPSRNAAAHAKQLQTGGEFLTHIWALLTHLRIEKSSLWKRD